MSGFTLLWGKMLHSSLWVQESKETRLVWVTLMMMKDSEGRVQSSMVGLADAAKVTLSECKEAVRILLSKDDNDSSKVEEGRRIREIPGGWQIVNHDLYRFSTEERRLFWAQQKAEQRAAAKAKAAAAAALREGKKKKSPPVITPEFEAHADKKIMEHQQGIKADQDAQAEKDEESPL